MTTSKGTSARGLRGRGTSVALAMLVVVTGIAHLGCGSSGKATDARGGAQGSDDSGRGTSGQGGMGGVDVSAGMLDASPPRVDASRDQLAPDRSRLEGGLLSSACPWNLPEGMPCFEGERCLGPPCQQSSEGKLCVCIGGGFICQSGCPLQPVPLQPVPKCPPAPGGSPCRTDGGSYADLCVSTGDGDSRYCGCRGTTKWTWVCER